MENQARQWYEIKDESTIPSPALLLFPDRVKTNIQSMLDWVNGDPDRLCPHVKTTKTEPIIRMMVEAGIKQFKCATVSEGEIALKAGAKFVLLAFQPTEPQAKRWIQLAVSNPDCRLGTVVDCFETATLLANLSKQSQHQLEVWLDLNIGMNRTGIKPGPDAVQLATEIQSSSNLNFGGIHAYDGHLHQSSIQDRQKACEAWHADLRGFMDTLYESGFDKIPVIAGGTPTFPMQAAQPDFTCSPGTCILWDVRYDSDYTDLNFSWACVILARVISKPDHDLLCLDLGHKAVASEMPHPRVHCLNLKVDDWVSHSEEHLVVRSKEAHRFQVGSAVYAVPFHVCPTVALHQHFYIAENGNVKEQWNIAARNRFLNY